MLGFLALLACGAPPQTHELRGEALGTIWHVKWQGPANARAKDAVVGALTDVDRKMSTWKADSEIRQLGAEPRQVSADTYDTVRAALDLARTTGGAFDPTVQPLVELWGFHGKPRADLPSPAELAQARARVGYDKVVIGERSVALRDGAELDLSAIAKGHAVDRVSDALFQLGLTDHMVEVGGEVRVRGDRDGAGWRLGVSTPREGATDLIEVLSLADAAMATSGNYRNVYEVDGRKVVHTLDPRSGQPVQGEVASATVVASTCRDADGWATALMVLGTTGLTHIEARDDLEALLYVTDGAGFRAIKSSGLDAYRPRD